MNEQKSGSQPLPAREEILAEVACAYDGGMHALGAGAGEALQACVRNLSGGIMSPGRALNRVLVVEDDPDIQVLASLILSELGGLVVEVCGSSSRTLEAVRSFEPDLILLDVMMPEMDGIAVFAALREDLLLAATPVVFMTARARTEEIARYRELGCLGVVTKPFEPESLVDTLHSLWGRREA
jgi:two-component system, OmpR family, response regulator